MAIPFTSALVEGKNRLVEKPFPQLRSAERRYAAVQVDRAILVLQM
jgi:hypothetical protein